MDIGRLCFCSERHGEKEEKSAFLPEGNLCAVAGKKWIPQSCFNNETDFAIQGCSLVFGAQSFGGYLPGRFFGKDRERLVWGI